MPLVTLGPSARAATLGPFREVAPWLEPGHPPDVHAAQVLLVCGLHNEAVGLALRAQGQAGNALHPQQRPSQAPCNACPASAQQLSQEHPEYVHSPHMQAFLPSLCEDDMHLKEASLHARQEFALVQQSMQGLTDFTVPEAYPCLPSRGFQAHATICFPRTGSAVGW